MSEPVFVEAFFCSCLNCSFHVQVLARIISFLEFHLLFKFNILHKNCDHLRNKKNLLLRVATNYGLMDDHHTI